MRNKILMDLFFYLAVPLLAWNFLREYYSDYLVILFGMIPAVIYTVVAFIRGHEWNVTGLFFLSLITLNLTMNLLSSTAEEELWNTVWIGYISIAFYTLTILFKNPIGIYLFIDYAYAQGVPRAKSTALYRLPENFHHFIKFTMFLVLREIVVIAVKTPMIMKMGVEGFNTIQITTSVINYSFTALMVLYIMYITKQVKKSHSTS